MGGGAAPRYAPEDPTLPKPWRGLVDGSTGYLYYWNPETNVTQYERPLEEQLPPPPPPLLPPPPPRPPPKSASVVLASSSSAAAAAAALHHHPDRDHDRHRHSSHSRSIQAGGSKGGSVSADNHGHGVNPNPSRDAKPAASAEAYRRQHEIIVTGDNVPAPFTTFESTNFSSEILKEDITQDIEGNLMVTGQWFYRPEEAEKRGGGSWQARDTRELFYSFHLDDVPAESVMHKCVVHFVPLDKKLPIRSEHPGFIVQKVYDTVERKLWKLTDKDYEDNKQHEIDLLVQKTRKRLGELADVEPEENVVETVEQLTSKRTMRRNLMNPIDVSRADDSTTRSDHLMKADTPGSCTSDTLKYNAILLKFKALTGDSYRDKWLDKLLQGIRVACSPKEDASADDKMSGSADDSTTGNTSTATIQSVSNVCRVVRCRDGLVR